MLIAFSEGGLGETALWLQRAVSPRKLFHVKNALTTVTNRCHWWR